MGYVVPNSKAEGDAKITQTAKLANAVQGEDTAALIQGIVTEEIAKRTRTVKMVNAVQKEGFVATTQVIVTEIPLINQQNYHLNPFFPKTAQRTLGAPRVSIQKIRHTIHMSLIHPVTIHVHNPAL